MGDLPIQLLFPRHYSDVIILFNNAKYAFFFKLFLLPYMNKRRSFIYASFL